MSASDHLSRACDYIARGEDYYRKAADEIVAARDEDPTLGYREVAAQLGKGREWCRVLVLWRTSGHDPSHPPFGGDDENEARYDRQARTALADPERRRTAMAALKPQQVEAVIEDAQAIALERLHARQAERDADERPVTPSAAGIENWDPSESWVDKLVMRIAQNARLLDGHVQQWGLVFGTMPPEEALAHLEETERRVADVRAAVQERIQDEATVA